MARKEATSPIGAGAVRSVPAPGSGSVVALWHRYGEGSKVYTYCAIRIGNAPRCWYLSGGTGAIRGSAPASPCTWEELLEFASGPIQVATGWEPVT